MDLQTISIIYLLNNLFYLLPSEKKMSKTAKMSQLNVSVGWNEIVRYMNGAIFLYWSVRERESQ